ncbi:MAG: 6-phospho-beta-glucosidase [Lachnospiraceae bacterium]|nr:6-phospho-beta-glucosidase [Lachnospiraceae bacterium]
MSGVKIVTIGGGSSYTPELIEGFINRYDILPVREIWLVDIEEGREKVEIITALAKRMIKKAGLPIVVKMSLDRREALPGADFVTTQIRVGQLPAREIDESIPLSHGILGQETNGAGGMFNGFRAIPVLLEIAADIAELCPKAWMINFSNPAGMVTEACIRYGATKRMIGLCNVPFNIEMQIAKLLEVEKSRIWVKFAGLNHMSYGVEIFLDGEDVTDQVIQKFNEVEMEGMKNINSINYEPEFIRALGVIPSFYHSYYYKKDKQLNQELEEFKEGKIRSQVVQKLEKELFELYKDETLDIKPAQLEERGGAYYSDAACNLIASIYNDTRDIQTVIVKNEGAIAGIDKDSAVEISAIITKDGPIPLTIGELPIAVNGLIQHMKSFERLTVEAAIEGDVEKAILALTINPLTPSDTIAKEVVVEMIAAQKEWLPNFYK